MTDHDPLDALLALAAYRPTWHLRAACRGVGTSTFFLGRGEDTAPARDLCRDCPVAERCAEAGLYERHGVWGGMSERQRREARKTSTGAA